MFPIPEDNIVKKNWRSVELKVALCYPNIYRAGMSGLTVQLLYALLNAREDVVCERFFLPTEDEPILSLESKQPIRKFDVAAFTFQYEEDYINALRMLINSGVEPVKVGRNMKPMVIAGGPCVTENPFPMMDFIDLFMVGELEPVLDDFVEGLKESTAEKTVENFRSVRGCLTSSDDKTKRVYVKCLDDAPHPLAQITPKVKSGSLYMPAWGRTFIIEALRGCPRKCRFCLISYIGEPYRERSFKRLNSIVSEGLKYTPVSKVSIIGAGIGYYSKLTELCEYIVDLGLDVSVPSLSVESVTEKLIRTLVRGGQRTISLAPESGCERLREIAGKKTSNRQIIEAAKIAFKNGIRNVKLYFLIGLPGERDEDIVEIGRLTRNVADVGFGIGGVRLSVNPLIPKPHTPFQFHRIMPSEYLQKAYLKIKENLSGDPRFELERFNPTHAQVQTALSLGDAWLGKIILKVAQYGGSLGRWRRVLKEEGETLEHLTTPPKIEDVPVWEAVDVKLS